jgi:plastocyanin
MVVPVNEVIHVEEQSSDVIHSFYVADFLYKRDVIPGRFNNFDFTPEKEGVYRGQCAEFCGLLHNKMTFTVKVTSRPEYEKWVEEQKAAEAKRLEECGDPATDVKIIAKNVAFNRSCFSLPVGQPFKIEFDNEDPGVAHNVAIYKDKSAKDKLLDYPPFAGVATKTEEGTPITPAGEYFFRCDVHPSMNGTVLVK